MSAWKPRKLSRSPELLELFATEEQVMTVLSTQNKFKATASDGIRPTIVRP